MELQIGDRVTWIVGKIKHTGVFLDSSVEKEEISNVMLHTRNGIRDYREVEVQTELIQLFND